MPLKRLAMLATAAFVLAVGGIPADAAQRVAAIGARASDAAPSEFSAQNRPRYRRVRPQINVRPGRLLYRRCVDWLAVEHRLSGTVLVPRERCWWVRG